MLINHDDIAEQIAILLDRGVPEAEARARVAAQAADAGKGSGQGEKTQPAADEMGSRHA